MKIKTASHNLRILTLSIIIFSIFSLTISEKLNANNSNNYSIFENDILQNKFEELIQLKNKFFFGNKICN